MSMQDSGPLDRWADWLLHGRQRGMSETQARGLARGLRRNRNRVLRGARLRAGQRMLDVGAGTGLLSLEALRRVGPSGTVVALDISSDALRECMRQAEAAGPIPSMQAVGGHALNLPFRDGTFDAVATRSVLIYVFDKRAALRELYRVLRPGGRASVFEPINIVYDRSSWDWGIDLTSLQPAHNQITGYLQEKAVDRRTMLSFDERDLTAGFEEAGFTSVSMSYEYEYSRERRRARDSVSFLRTRPNPSQPSYEEGARVVLGTAADEHLARLSALLRSQHVTSARAVAYIVGRRSRKV